MVIFCENHRGKALVLCQKLLKTAPDKGCEGFYNSYGLSVGPPVAVISLKLIRRQVQTANGIH
jgi:hypothetical protein